MSTKPGPAQYAEKIRLFAWFLQKYGGTTQFKPTNINKCFDDLGLERPANTARSLQAMTESKPKVLLKSANGYSLERRAKDAFDDKYGEREATIAVHKMLAELPARIPGIEERDFLNEALTCLKYKAFRAAVVMAWNLAYFHFIRWVYNDAGRLAKFNTQLPNSYPKADVKMITDLDDFSRLKEDQVLQVAKSAGVLTSSLYNVMSEKLKRRNTAAHPSNVAVHQMTAEDCIKDLVENVVLKLT